LLARPIAVFALAFRALAFREKSPLQRGDVLLIVPNKAVVPAYKILSAPGESRRAGWGHTKY
jgi:hypothetical protein